jgi:hypothetical protein
MSSYDDSNVSGISSPVIFAIVTPTVLFTLIMITCCLKRARRVTSQPYPDAGPIHHGPRGIASYAAGNNPAGLRHPDPLIVAEQGLAQPPPAYSEQDPVKLPKMETRGSAEPGFTIPSHLQPASWA